MEWYFGNWMYLFLLALVPVLLFAALNFLRWKNKRKELFADQRFQKDLFEKDSKSNYFFVSLYAIGSVFLILSIVDFIKGSEEVESQQKLNNVIFLLDVSNSMNAEDIEPSRLVQAKNIIVNTMSKFTNDRVGIVVFAGESTSVMPLTSDYVAAENYISGIQTEVIKTQGTDFLKGMQMAAKKFKSISKGARNVVLVSDGEDNEGNEGAAIQFAKSQGMMVTTVGIGTEDGAPVPTYMFGQLMGYKTDMYGQTVISKRQTEALQKIAKSTGGSYIDGNNLDSAIKDIHTDLSKLSSSTLKMVKANNGIHYYQYFLAISILCFFLIYLFNPKRDLNF